jgi:type IV pilus assembly protein PilY1
MKFWTHKNLPLAAFTLALVWLIPTPARAQTTYTENFTGASTTNSWYFINGACLTAGGSTSTASPGQIPSCVSLSYYTNKGDPFLSNGTTPFLNGGNTGTLPDDPTVGGALRFTNGYAQGSNQPHGYNQNGAILSNFTFPSTNGLQVTFTTETYEGNSGGGGGDGADGISFFLQSTDNGQTPDIGAFGGSLAYTCSNSNNDGTLRSNGQPRGYDGLVGGYMGLGIDEYGNFLNQSDNTSTGWGYQWNRIGLRGAGSTAWSYLNATYPAQYPSALSYTQRASAVQKTCSTGYVWNYSVPGSPVTTNIKVGNYAAIPNAYKILTNVKIANESALYRGDGSQTSTQYGVPITYNLKITTTGLLSLSYSYNGGVYQPVITGQDISVSNGLLPNNVRFGFAGSSGGSTNIHEIMCFQAAPAVQTSSSAGVNQKQSAKVQVGTQVYFAYYNSNNWPGSLTSQYLIPDPNNTINLIYAPTANWDASCVLTGVLSGQTCAATTAAGPTAAEGPTNRTIVTWDGTKGIPLEWTNLTSAQKTALDTGDSAVNSDRLNFLRGDRSKELDAHGAGSFRARTSVLGDIVDSSPTWVGPPQVSYLTPWKDALYTSTTMPENSGQSYVSFMSSKQQRTNVVYAGSNDGMLHGFRSGSYNSSNVYDPTNNDGYEVFAYMPGYVLNNINASTNVSNDFSNPQYGHKFSVDATPGTGDLYYGNNWHTWLVGGLGAGGNAIYAIDITDPDNSFNNNEGNAANAVIGEWNPTTLTCANVAACGGNLGRTYGIPQIRRFHNGAWGAVFGNGFGSSTGDAGIYVMTVDPNTGSTTFYYLSTHQAAGAVDGIAFTTPADFDNDGVVDFVYAGDLLGNVWRFDLTDKTPSNWAVTPGPLYSTGSASAQPITTQVLVLGVTSNGSTRVLVEFGTGRQTPQTNTSAATYSTTRQSLYGIWDWNMTSWNAKMTFPLVGLPTAPSSALTLTDLQQQTITGSFDASLGNTGNAYRTVSNKSVCWANTSGCSKFGWYMQLPVGPADPSNTNSPVVAEQVNFSPALLSGVFVVNTTVPPTNTPTKCNSTQAASWLMGLDPATGGAQSVSYFEDTHHKLLNANYNGIDQGISGMANVGTGSPSEIIGTAAAGGANQHYLVLSPCINCGSPGGPGGPGGPGPGGPGSVNPQANTTVQRLTWTQRR